MLLLQMSGHPVLTFSQSETQSVMKKGQKAKMQKGRHTEETLRLFGKLFQCL
jgi:hypothetical protein